MDLIAQEKQLDELLNLMEVDFFEDETFVICGGMNDYTDKRGKEHYGLLSMLKKGIDEEGNKIEGKEKLEDILHKKAKKRIGNKLYTYEKAIECVKDNFCSKIGLWLPKGFVVVDTDTKEDSEKFMQYIKEHDINTSLIKTKNGYHGIFRYDGNDILNSAKKTTKAGFNVDYRVGGDGYIVLPYNDKNREIINLADIEYIRDGLFPIEETSKTKGVSKKTIGSKKNNEVKADKDLIEGGRNDGLFRKLSGFVNNVKLRNYENLLAMAMGLNQIYCKPPLPLEEVESITSGVIEKYAPEPFYNDKGKIIPYILAQRIVKDFNVISDKLSSYIYKDNTYEEVPTDFYNVIDGYIEDKELLRISTVKEVTGHVKSQSYRDTIENSREYINFKNGLLNIKTREIIGHTQEVITLGSINGNYDTTKGDITGTNFEQLLTSSLDESLIPVIQEMLGVCLYPLTDKVHYFYTLIGEGRNGKGILLDIILNIIPSNLRSGITMKDYDTRFANASIKGKTVNICTDDNTVRLEGIGNLKSVTAGEGIFVEKKGVDGEMIKATLTHISSFNQMPSVQEKSNALFDRMIVIPFNVTFGTEEEVREGLKDKVKNPYLKQSILDDELDIIINWALKGLFRVIDNNYAFTKPVEVLDKLEQYRSEVDSVRAWIKEDVTIVKEAKQEDYINLTKLCKIYKSWCEDEELVPVGKRTFSDGLKRYLKGYYKSINNRDCYAVITGYKGQGKL